MAAGDVITSRYLLYIEAIALEERGRNEESIAVARSLLAALAEADWLPRGNSCSARPGRGRWFDSPPPRVTIRWWRAER
jgi:hypothetical protein